MTTPQAHFSAIFVVPVQNKKKKKIGKEMFGRGVLYWEKLHISQNTNETPDSRSCYEITQAGTFAQKRKYSAQGLQHSQHMCINV